MKQTKTDNRSLSTKVELRRRILREAGFGRIRLLETCVGQGKIWRELSKEFRIETRLPVDKAPRMRGTLRATSNRRLLDGLDYRAFNVIDVDTYGSPWTIWSIIAPKISGKTAVFLTHGIHGRGTTSNHDLEVAGIPLEWGLQAFGSEVAKFVSTVVWRRLTEHLRTSSALIAALPNVVYMGMIVEPGPKTP